MFQSTHFVHIINMQGVMVLGQSRWKWQLRCIVERCPSIFLDYFVDCHPDLDSPPYPNPAIILTQLLPYPIQLKQFLMTGWMQSRRAKHKIIWILSSECFVRYLQCGVGRKLGLRWGRRWCQIYFLLLTHCVFRRVPSSHGAPGGKIGCWIRCVHL